MKIVILLILGSFLINQRSIAQKYKWQVKVDSVKSNGFHNILLNPSVNCKLNADFSDIRIFDDKNIEIPYLLRTEIPITYSQLFKEYKIISKEIIRGVSTRLIIENLFKSKVNNVSIIAKNSDVQKRVKLYGSDDQQNWFVIKDNYLFHSVYSDLETSEMKLMNFPLSDYAFFKIEVDDSKNAPINILKVGYYDTYSETGKYIEVPNLKISQTDSTRIKKSFVKFSFEAEQYIDKLELNINGPLYYLRKGQVANLVIDTLENGEISSYYEILQQIDISSNNSNTINFSKFKTKEFYIIIDNEDNQPLKISKGTAYQLINFLTANLDSKRQYFLKFGNREMSFPEYDLKYFEENIPHIIPLIATGEITELVNDEIKEKTSSGKNKIILWIVIALVIVFFTFLTVKMVRDMK